MNDLSYNILQQLYGQINSPIKVINTNGKIIYVNDSFKFMWGYSLKDLEKYSIFDDPELIKNGTVKKIKQVIKANRAASVENYSDTLLKENNYTIPLLRTAVFPVSLSETVYVVLFHEDQTEIFLTEKEIVKARERNKEAERLKDTFLNVLSHELRTPLNIILGYSSILKDSVREKLNAEDRSYLDNLYIGSERLFKTISQMLEFAQIESGSYSVNIESFELNSLVKNCLNLVKPEAAVKKLVINENFKFDPVYVEADVQCIEHALNALLSNALKFTQRGFIEVETFILEEKELAFCKVKDSGVGISTSYFDHLYRPFSQEDLGVGRSFEGNGLGLALAKKYIERMGGSLLVDSIKGVGSTFTFTLPLSHLEKNDGKENDKTKILMINHSIETYELVNAFLKKEFKIDSFDLDEFDSRQIDAGSFNLLMMDVNPNNWEGSVAACKKIKLEEKRNIPVLILSNEFIEEKIKEFYESGADVFITKPFSKKILLEAVSAVKDYMKEVKTEKNNS
jgi:PAS domain S-box-containing protein